MEGAPHVVLVGLMGSGKTSIGKPLAARLGRRYVDNDQELQRRTGRTAREIAATDGIERLHAEEAAALLDALGREPAAVVGAAASVIESTAVREKLRDQFVVWLDTDIDVLARKVRAKTHRPYAERDPVELLTEQYQRRAPLYEAVAAYVVHPDARSDDAVADQIAELVQ